MPPTFVKAFQVAHGTYTDAATDSEDQLYVSPQELEARYGCCASVESIRAAMALINSHCNRASLFPCLYDSGDIEVPWDRQECRLPITPVIEITDIAGRFGMGRRDRQGWNAYNMDAAAFMVMIGGAPMWTPIDKSLVALDANTGVIWIPNSFLYARYNYVRVRFVAGLITIPERVKLAVLELMQSMANKGVSDRTRYAVGRVSRTYASDSFMTPQAKALLEPYCVQSLY